LEVKIGRGGKPPSPPHPARPDRDRDGDRTPGTDCGVHRAATPQPR
jgi:hypothetical protein